MRNHLPGRFLVGEKAVDNNCSSVYSGYDQKQKKDVIIKHEEMVGASQIEKEVRVYNALCPGRHDGFSKMLFSRRVGLTSIIVLERLGDSLENLHKIYGPFSMSCIAMITIQVLNRLETLHGINFVHGEVCPRSIFFGRRCKNEESLLYLSNFRQSSRFRAGNGLHVLFIREKHLDQSKEFSPPSRHRNIIQSRRDDLLSLSYLMVFLHRGSLPWMKETTTKGICSMKERIRPKDLFKEMSPYFVTFYKMVKNLDFPDNPNYNDLLQAMRDVLSDSGEVDEKKFPWTQ